MRSALAAAVLAALLVAVPAQAAGPPPDPEPIVADALAQAPDLPAHPTGAEVVAIVAAAAVGAGQETIATVLLVQAASDEAAALALATFDAGQGQVEELNEAAAAQVAATIAGTPAQCWLDDGVGCATWLGWYYPGVVDEAMDIDQATQDAALGMFNGAFEEYNALPGRTPVPGVIVGPGLGWVQAMAVEVPAYAFASAQYTLVVADVILSGTPEGASLGAPGVGWCEALECNLAYLLLACAEACPEEVRGGAEAAVSAIFGSGIPSPDIEDFTQAGGGIVNAGIGLAAQAFAEALTRLACLQYEIWYCGLPVMSLSVLIAVVVSNAIELKEEAALAFAASLAEASQGADADIAAIANPPLAFFTVVMPAFAEEKGAAVQAFFASVVPT